MDIVSPILNVVSFLWTCTGAKCYLCDLKENKEALNTAMEELKDTRDDVKRRVDEEETNPNDLMKRTQQVHGWLERVQTIEVEVVEILQKADQEIEGRFFGGHCTKNCWSAHKIGKMVFQKLALVKDLSSKGSFDDVAYKLPPPSVQQELMDPTMGMDSLFDKVWRSLADDEVRIMGLYGQGGVGKTTLLKQINNEFIKTTTPGFDVVISVVVSKEINVEAIQKEIGKRLGLGLSSSSPPDKTSIFNALAKKNFVLLLDDIWERVDLQKIGIPRPQNKSKIIFTTRSEDVCGRMDVNKKIRVECLPWNDAWNLFKEKLGNEALICDPKVHELAVDVAKECGGLPLALITIGRAMSTKKTLQEWNHAITTLRKYAAQFPGMSDEVFPRLKLSYDSLRNETIKSCFLYCSLFPEDYSINKAQLIEYWFGEGFLNEFDNIDEARNYGYDVIGSLKGACLLESGEETDQVKMHDTIRDLALWIACEFGRKRDNILVETWTSSYTNSFERWKDAVRIYCMINSREDEDHMRIEVPPPPPKCPNLQTLIMNPQYYFGVLSMPQTFFQFTPLLRVLDLSHIMVMEIFPISITELAELQYLDLSFTPIETLPGELRKLVKLKYLNLSYMDRLSKIPHGVISSLSELQVLNIYDSFGTWDDLVEEEEEEFDDGRGARLEEVNDLKYLNDIGITIKRDDKNVNLKKLLGNPKLQMYLTSLRMSDVSSSTTILSLANMKNLKALWVERWEDLTNIEFLNNCGSSEAANSNAGLLSSLEKLTLEWLPKLNMVWHDRRNHMQYYSFQNLQEINITGCNALKELTWIVYVGNPQFLKVWGCEEIEEILIVDDDFGGDDKIFKRLKTLELWELPKLKSICSRHTLAFPSLESIKVVHCPELKKLPFDSSSSSPCSSLKKIKGEREWWNELEWEDDNVKSKFLPYFEDFDF